MKYVQRLFTALGILALTALAAAFLVMDFSADTEHSLSAYPNAQWRGGPDGGAYFEITQEQLPYFHVQIRHENGDLWKEGWFRLNAATKEKALSSIIGYDGGDALSLHQNAELFPQRPLQKASELEKP
ncbi:hypothetical protein H681_03890 [Pseudomonas sp. ATCC 13867]|uniref:hypothetical protein n=1 Tax=Pseudomonas sp. ATCC 13867 TaxID=1294143 RepID=UPI0002C4DC2E|nr:hypothetical protein [Pseudomonas sp. ATCC 13867]AGI22660.1 hypothetical protein H681_03890 [Pseudomonas sp. ATCC 13867]RFQ16950.1 hypothetical protein D0N87_26375 [Pseudomonas sp. ATCC 13867]